VTSEPDLIQSPITAALIRGALELEQSVYGVLPHRLPGWARERADPQLAFAQAQPSGVRLAFRTAASRIVLETLPTKQVYVDAPARPDGVYELVLDGQLVAQATAQGGTVLTIDMTTGAMDVAPGEPVSVEFNDLGDHEKDVELWLPWNERTELVALHTDAPVEATPDTRRKVWLHHGSSISQGSNAESPTSTWAALAAFAAGVELVNLGFGGGALLDPFVARAMRDTPADLISVKIGINLVNTDLMRLRGFAPAVHGFLDTIRDGHPSTPLLVVSPLLWPIHERTPGPAAPDLSRLGSGVLSFLATGDPEDRTRLTLEIIRDELSRITTQRATEDPNLFYLDGRGLYGEKDLIDLPLPDQLHPDPAAHRRIGRRFAELVLGGDGMLAGTSSISNV
jgi:hypothetical protein